MTEVREEQPRVARPEDATILAIDDVIVDYPLHGSVVRAVDEAALEIRRGHRVAVVGESGSGKSTLALAVLGLLEPPGHISEGSIRLGDLELAGASEDALRKVRGGKVSMIFQDALGSLNPVKTIEFQLVEAIRQHDRVSEAEARERAISLLTEVGVHAPANPSQAVPARVLRRHAPARDDRDGARVQPRPADRGRADDRARRDDAGERDRPPHPALG